MPYSGERKNKTMKGNDQNLSSQRRRELSEEHEERIDEILFVDCTLGMNEAPSLVQLRNVAVSPL